MGVVGRGLIEWVLVVLINALPARLRYKGLLLGLQRAPDTDAFAQHSEGRWEAGVKNQ